jgi:hypothetical protein
VVDRSGMGTNREEELYAPCIYRWRRTADGQEFLVQTTGEYTPNQDVSFHSMGPLTAEDRQRIQNIEALNRSRG